MKPTTSRIIIFVSVVVVLCIAVGVAYNHLMDEAIAWGGNWEISAADAVPTYTVYDSNACDAIITWNEDANDCITLEYDGWLTPWAEPNDVASGNSAAPCTMADRAYEIVAADPNAIRRLAESGAICEVFGHRWRDGRPGGNDLFEYVYYHPKTAYRTCSICGDGQSRINNDWTVTP